MEHPSPEIIIRTRYLLHLSVKGRTSVQQQTELDALLAEFGETPAVRDLLQDVWRESALAPPVFSAATAGRMLTDILDTRSRAGTFPWYRRPVTLRAAVAVLVLGFVAALYIVKKAPVVTPVETSQADVLPGKANAILSRSDGKSLVLNNMAPGEILRTTYATVYKTADGQLDYRSLPGVTANTPVARHTIATPKKGKFCVKLPDGSLVWLNADSRVTFPLKLDGPIRRIEIAGEAYIEVKTVMSGRRKSSFEVVAGNQVVQVRGTHFNVNSYRDEQTVRTTLLEGSVDISDRDGQKLARLKPGEQSEVGHDGRLQRVYALPTTEAVVAWRSDLFQFDGTDVPGAMRQIARWYDIDVRYNGHIPAGHITGYISRQVPLSEVLHMLEKTSDLRFERRNRTLIVNDITPGEAVTTPGQK